MVAKGTPHIFCTTRLCRQLDRLLGDVWRQAASRLRAVVPCQEPIILPSDSEPEPDVAIARGNETDYLPHHPCVLDLIISSDGDIPLLMRAGDGNEADKAVFGKY